MKRQQKDFNFIRNLAMKVNMRVHVKEKECALYKYVETDIFFIDKFEDHWL